MTCCSFFYTLRQHGFFYFWKVFFYWMYVCIYVHPGSGCHAPSWCLLGWTRSWTRRRCWRAGSLTFASQFRWPTIVPCNTAARCRETPAVKPVIVTKDTHKKALMCCAVEFLFLYRAQLCIIRHKNSASSTSGKTISTTMAPRKTHSCTLSPI